MKMDQVLSAVKKSRHDKTIRNRLLVLIILAGLCILIIPNLLWKKSAERDLSRLTAKYREFSRLSHDYQSLRERVRAMEQKRGLTQPKGIVQAIGEMAQSVGVKGKLKSIRETGIRHAIDRLREETAEIQIEKINMTEMLHLMYRVEHAPMMLAVKNVTIKKSFENPELLDVSMSLSLFSGEGRT